MAQFGEEHLEILETVNGSVQQHVGFLRQTQTSQVLLKDSVVIGFGIRTEVLFPLR